MTERLRHLHRSTLLHGILWLVPLGAVIWWATRQQPPKWPDTAAEWTWLGAALVAYAVVTLLRGERWHSILEAADVDVDRGDAYGLTVVGYAGNNALPARGGELLRIFLLSSRTGVRRRTAIGSILAERVLDALALGTILVVVAYDLVRKLGSKSPLLVMVGLGLVALAGLGLAWLWWRHRHHAERLIDAIRPVLEPLKPLLSLRGVYLLGMSFVIWGIEASVYAMVGESVGIHLGLVGAMSVVAFANLAALIPAAPGAIGTYDAAVLFATRTVTRSKDNLLPFLLLLRFVVYMPITIVGGVLLFVRYGGLERLRAARASASAGKDVKASPAEVSP